MDNPERISLNGGATNREKCKTWRIGLEGAVDTAALVRFGFITDSHYAPHLDCGRLQSFSDCPHGMLAPPCWGECRRYGDSLEKMRRFVRHMNRLGVVFVVEGGDFKDLGRTPEESLAYLDAIESAFSEFRGPRYHVLGNHDHDNLSKNELLARVANSGQRTARAWYSFDCKGVRFIVLDGNYRSDGKPYCRGNFDWRDCFIPQEQIEFLRSELASAPGPCVPFLHQQLDATDDTRIAVFEELGWDWTYHAYREARVWNVELESVRRGLGTDDFRPAADTPRKRVLLEGFAKK